jgi:rhamnulokinase/L-fuculokinase
MTANACGAPILAGPAEATVLGNVLAQMIAQGELSGLREARDVVRRSVEVKEYLPEDTAAWRAAREAMAR